MPCKALLIMFKHSHHDSHGEQQQEQRRKRQSRSLGAFPAPLLVSCLLLVGSLATCRSLLLPSAPRRHSVPWARSASSSALLYQKSGGGDGDASGIQRQDRNVRLKKAANNLKRMRKLAANTKIVDGLFDPAPGSDGGGRPLVDLALVGTGCVGALSDPTKAASNQAGKAQPIRCVWLAAPAAADDVVRCYLAARYARHFAGAPAEALPDVVAERLPASDRRDVAPLDLERALLPTSPTRAVPLPVPLTREASKELRLLSFAFRQRYVSKSVLLGLAKILTDKDGGLWDNLPWTEWTIDPERKARDQATGKVLPKKYLLGKRDGYNRMLGKDWYGRSLSGGNAAARLKYGLEDSYDEWLSEDTARQDRRAAETEGRAAAGAGADGAIVEEGGLFGDDGGRDPAMEASLALRILQLQGAEAEMALAEAERGYAVLKTRLLAGDGGDNLDAAADALLLRNYEAISGAVARTQGALERKEATDLALENFLARSEEEEGAARTAVTTELEATIGRFLADIVSTRFFDAGDTAPDDSVQGKSATEAAKEAAAAAATLWEETRAATAKFVDGIGAREDLVRDLDTVLDREAYKAVTKSKDLVGNFLDGIIERETRNAPPYRGAIGYSPRVDTKEEMFKKAVLPYRSPYDLLAEIVEEQFHAEVVAAVLENSSLFPGTLVLEGAVVLRRRGRTRTVTLGGEAVEVEDDGTAALGNDGVAAGALLIVECSGDEAVGMALACDVPVSVEARAWEDVATDVRLDAVEPLGAEERESVTNAIPPVVPVAPDGVAVTEGGEALVGGRREGGWQTGGADKREGREEADMVVGGANTPPLRSVADFDALSVPDKARFVLTSGGYEGKLPRPRVLREFEWELEDFMAARRSAKKTGRKGEIRTTLSPLDEILVPLIPDASVRQEIRMRDAILRDDKFAVETIEMEVEKLRAKEEAQ